MSIVKIPFRSYAPGRQAARVRRGPLLGWVAASAAAIALAACGWWGAPPRVTPLHLGVDGAQLSAPLAEEYRLIAANPRMAGGPSEVLSRLEEKAANAESGRIRPPEQTGEWDVPAGEAAALRSARQELLRALAGRGVADFPMAGARALARYDCWVVASSDPAMASAAGPCRADFERSVAVLDRLAENRVSRGLADAMAFFPRGSDQLTADARAVVQSVAADIRSGQAGVVAVVGHSDDQVGSAADQALSERRANAISSALVAAGVPQDQIRTMGLGANAPMMVEAATRGDPMNRRVEFWYL